MSVASRTNVVHHRAMKEDALVQFKLMLPAGLKGRVESHANASRRSLSQEIVAALAEMYPPPKIKLPLDLTVAADYLVFVESAESEVERDEFIRLANEEMKANPATEGFRIGLTLDPDGVPTLFIGRAKKK